MIWTRLDGDSGDRSNLEAVALGWILDTPIPERERERRRTLASHQK